MTDPKTMDQILDLLTENEVEHALHSVDVFEHAEFMTAEEPAEWRRRIGARQAFLELRESGPGHRDTRQPCSLFLDPFSP